MNAAVLTGTLAMAISMGGIVVVTSLAALLLAIIESNQHRDH